MIADSSRHVERYCRFDSLHYSHCLRTQTDCLGEAALRQQLAVYKRNVPRPKLNNRDRLFWICLRIIWRPWKSALMIVQPETVTSSASRSVHTILVEVVASETTGSPADWF